MLPGGDSVGRRALRVTWAEFKRLVDKELAEANGDEEEVLSINWGGLDDPVVVFQTIRRGSETRNLVQIT